MNRIALVLVVMAAACGGDAATPTTTAASTTVPTTVAATSATTTPPVATTGSSETTSTAATTTTGDDTLVIQVAVRGDGIGLVVDGLVLGSGGRIAVDRGTPVRIVTTGEVAEEVHVHGYDLQVAVTPGAEETLEFVADIPGIFEVELEGSGMLLFELEVS